MTRTPRPLPQIVEDVTAEALALASALAAAEAIQWSPSQSPKPRDDTSERARGGHGDPTLATVVDDRRLAVRAAVVSGHVEIEKLLPILRAAREEVQEAVDRWHG